MPLLALPLRINQTELSCVGERQWLGEKRGARGQGQPEGMFFLSPAATGLRPAVDGTSRRAIMTSAG
jgi:hypothetical protein